jgi:hypothetical protein
MYEFHGWFGLAETTSEADAGGLVGALDDLRPLLGWFTPPQSLAEVRALNGQYFLWVNGLLNRPRDEEGAVDDVLSFLAKRLPGSWGLVYDRSDDWSDPPRSNAFRVRVLARGRVTIREDSFLSPWRPTIED